MKDPQENREVLVDLLTSNSIHVECSTCRCQELSWMRKSPKCQACFSKGGFIHWQPNSDLTKVLDWLVGRIRSYE